MDRATRRQQEREELARLNTGSIGSNAWLSRALRPFSNPKAFAEPALFAGVVALVAAVAYQGCAIMAPGWELDLYQ